MHRDPVNRTCRAPPPPAHRPTVPRPKGGGFSGKKIALNGCVRDLQTRGFLGAPGPWWGQEASPRPWLHPRIGRTYRTRGARGEEVALNDRPGSSGAGRRLLVQDWGGTCRTRWARGFVAMAESHGHSDGHTMATALWGFDSLSFFFFFNYLYG